jgi:hypothetical protein
MKYILLMASMFISFICIANEEASKNTGPVYNFNFYNNASPKLDFGKKEEEKKEKDKTIKNYKKVENGATLKNDRADINPKATKTSRWQWHLQYHLTGIAQNISSNNSFDEVSLHNYEAYVLGVSYAGVKLAYGFTSLKQNSTVNYDTSEKELMGNKIFIEYDQPISSNRLGFFGGFSSMQIDDVLDDSSSLTNIEIESTSLYLGLKYNYKGINIGLSMGRTSNRVNIYNSPNDFNGNQVIDPNGDGGLTQFEGNSSELGVRLGYAF